VTRGPRALVAALAAALCGWLCGCVTLARSDPRVQAATAQLPAPRVAAGQLDARRLLGELPARASRLGAGAPSLVASAQAVDNGWVGGFVDVPRDDCVLGYARGSSSIDDVDVAIYSEEGTALAVDEGRDVHPTVMMCSPHPDRVYLAAHVVEGEGLVAVGARSAPSSSRAPSGRGASRRRDLARPTLGPVSTTPSARIGPS
jgi:hypothetical protein